MNKLVFLVISFVSALAVLAGASALASGGGGDYRNPFDGAGFTTTHSPRYNLGKEIFTGKARLGSQSASLVGPQTKRLKAMQEQLPENIRSHVDLTSLAGHLSGQQMAALEYYLAQRYHVQ